MRALGFALCLQVCMTMVKVKKRELISTKKERGTQGKGGFYKKNTNSYAPSKEWRNITLL